MLRLIATRPSEHLTLDRATDWQGWRVPEGGLAVKSSFRRRSRPWNKTKKPQEGLFDSVPLGLKFRPQLFVSTVRRAFGLV